MARARLRRKKTRKKTRQKKTRQKGSWQKSTRQNSSQRKKTRQAPKRRIRIVVPQPTPAETLLLSLAKDLAGAPLDRALCQLADAFAPNADLPREVYGAWIKSRHEKTATLALSWAREQVRLSLEETITRSPRNRRTPALAPDTLAWLLLAACEAIAHEPPSAVADRVRAVLELSGHAAPGG
jgi:hypothetical protein